MKVTMDAGLDDVEWKQTSDAITPAPREIPMSYAEAKEIALLRQELRACWERADRVAGRDALARLARVAGNDNELCAETRRWAARFEAA
jgi:hypothetical protein